MNNQATKDGVVLIGEAAEKYVEFLYHKMFYEFAFIIIFFGGVAYGIYRLVKYTMEN